MRLKFLSLLLLAIPLFSQTRVRDDQVRIDANSTTSTIARTQKDRNSDFATLSTWCSIVLIDHTSCIQAAVTKTPKRKLVADGGPYTITAAINITNKADFVFDGQSATIIQTTDHTRIFVVSGGTYVTITNWDLVGVGTDWVDSSSGFSGADGIAVLSCTNAIISNNYLINFGQAAIFHQYATGLLVTGNTIIGPGPDVIHDFSIADSDLVSVVDSGDTATVTFASPHHMAAVGSSLKIHGVTTDTDLNKGGLPYTVESIVSDTVLTIETADVTDGTYTDATMWVEPYKNGNFGIYSADFAVAAVSANISIVGNTLWWVGTGMFFGSDTNVLISGNNLSDILGQHGIYAYFNKSSVIGNVFNNIIDTPIVIRSNYLATEDTTDIVVEGNNASGGKGGIVITGDSATYSFRRVKVNNNNLSNQGQPIYISAINANTGFYDTEVSHNTVFNATEAFGIRVSVGSGNAVVAHNIVNRTLEAGYYLTNDGTMTTRVEFNESREAGYNNPLGGYLNSGFIIDGATNVKMIGNWTFAGTPVAPNTADLNYSIFLGDSATAYLDTNHPDSTAPDYLGGTVLQDKPVPNATLQSFKASVLYIANGTSTCTNISGCWQITKIDETVEVVNAGGGSTDYLVLTPYIANPSFRGFRVHPTTACVNAGELNVWGFGDSTSSTYFNANPAISAAFSLTGVVSDTNILNFSAMGVTIPAASLTITGTINGSTNAFNLTAAFPETIIQTTELSGATIGNNYVGIRLHSPTGTVSGTSAGCAFDVWVYVIKNP